MYNRWDTIITYKHRKQYYTIIKILKAFQN